MRKYLQTRCLIPRASEDLGCWFPSPSAHPVEGELENPREGDDTLDTQEREARERVTW